MHAAARVFLCVAALTAAAPLSALIIQGGAIAAVHERFDSGFPGAPVPNPSGSFLGAGLDLSGVGWLTASPQLSLTLISPQHFVITDHTRPANGASVSFLNQAGVLKTYTVDSTFTVLHAPGVNTDIAIGRLTAPISGSDLVASYPILSVPDYAGLPLFVYGQGGRVGTNTLEAIFADVDMLPFGGGNAVADSTLFTTDFDAVAGETQAQSGDSGSPTFYVAGATLALLGVHSAIDTAGDPDLTYDSFIPAYAAQINALLAIDGYSLQAIPEPATLALLGGLAALVITARRRITGTR